MDLGNTTLIICRLVFGTVSTFFAILLWSRTRDAAWIFVIIGAVIAYVEIIYSILNLLGFISENILSGNAALIISIFLSCMPTVSVIAAFSIMVFRKYRRRTK